MLGSTRNLTIEAEIDSRGAQRGAREANRAQDSVARKARELSREQVKAQGGVIQQTRNLEREQKKLERTLDGLERKSALHGLRGVERIRAQQRALEAQARAAGATAEQIQRIGRAYDQMANRAAAAERRSQAARGRVGGGAGFGAGAVLARGGAIGAGVIAAVGAGGAIGAIAERAGRLSDLPAALGQIANNSGVAESRLRGVVGQLQALDFTLVQAQKSTALFAQAGIPQLLDKMEELSRGARNLSVISGIAPSEALEGIGGAILKGELDLLETQGLVGIKFEDGYKRYAAAIGKASVALTEQEKVMSRLQQVLEKLLAVQGVYEQSLDKSGGALRNISVQGNRAFDALALLLDPAITAGATALSGALRRVADSLTSIGGWTASPDFKAYMAALSVLSNVGVGGFKPFASVGMIPGAFGFKPPTDLVGPPSSLASFVGPPRSAMNRSVGGIGAAVAGRPEPGGYYGFDELASVRRGLRRQLGQVTGPESQISASLGLAQRLNGGGGPNVPMAAGGSVGSSLFQGGVEEQLSGLERWKTARERQIEDERRAITRANEQLFQDLKFQSADLFRAMVGGGRDFWNFFKNAGLTAMSEVFSTQVANLLTGRSGAGGLGGLLGGIGGIGRPGAPGGTSGFAGPVGLAGTAGLGATAGGGLGIGAALSSPLLLGFGGAVAAAQLPGRGPVAGGLRGAAVGGSAGVGAIGALLGLAPGLVATGPLGAAILGVGIGAGALIGALTSGARQKARTKVREVYGVTVRDGGVLAQIVEAGKAYGSLGVAIQSPQIRELVQLYAMSTGQDPAGGVTTQLASAVRLRAVNGMLFQDVQFANGRPSAAPSSLPLLGVNRNQSVNVVQLDGAATTSAIEGAAYRAVAQSGELVQQAGDRAMRMSAGRRQQATLLMEPFTAVSS